MTYYEIYRKKKVDPVHVDFKYFKTVNGVSKRDEEKKRLAKLGYRVRTKKTWYTGPPEIKRVAGRSR